MKRLDAYYDRLVASSYTNKHSMNWAIANVFVAAFLCVLSVLWWARYTHSHDEFFLFCTILWAFVGCAYAFQSWQILLAISRRLQSPGSTIQ